VNEHLLFGGHLTRLHVFFVCTFCNIDVSVLLQIGGFTQFLFFPPVFSVVLGEQVLGKMSVTLAESKARGTYSPQQNFGPRRFRGCSQV